LNDANNPLNMSDVSVHHGTNVSSSMMLVAAETSPFYPVQI
jgi:hypothetical protein